MPISLFVEQHDRGIAFYINGELQFDSSDEALYHEYLVIPTIALAVKRFPQTNLRVLICGGGDGLAARDVLKFPEVSKVDLVDYNPDVIELANTVFKTYNQGSLGSDRVTVTIQEALEFVTNVPDHSYHAAICDFTYPNNAEETVVYSREWFQQISRVLIPGGIASSNGVSPERTITAFWCLYQTLLSAGLQAKPMQVQIPSFEEQGLGIWGFFLASSRAIKRTELEAIILPNGLQTFAIEQLLNNFKFNKVVAQIRHTVAIHTLGSSQIVFYLLNPTLRGIDISGFLSRDIDFLEIEETGTGLVSMTDPLQFESIVKACLERLYQSPEASLESSDITQLIPIQHPYHNSTMVNETIAYLKQSLTLIDLSQLLNKLLERSQELPTKIVTNLKQLAENIRTGQPLQNLPPQTAEFLMMLSITLLIANLTTPDAAFSKGYFYTGSGTSSTSSTTFSADEYNSEFTKLIGGMMTLVGATWLILLLRKYLEDNE